MITVDFRRIRIAPGDQVLDVGCGTGRHTCGAYRQPGIVVIGTDLQYQDVCQTRKNLQFHDQLGHHGGGTWDLLVSDIRHLPFPDNSFDAVICSEVMEHIVHQKKAASELVRVLKPRKTLAVSVPRYYPERICWALSKEYHRNSGGHLRIYRKRDLMALFENTGVKIDAVHYAHSLHTPYWWWRCAVSANKRRSKLLDVYQKILEWQIMKKPMVADIIEQMLNPLMGKSLVVYFTKHATECISTSKM